MLNIVTSRIERNFVPLFFQGFIHSRLSILIYLARLNRNWKIIDDTSLLSSESKMKMANEFLHEIGASEGNIKGVQIGIFNNNGIEQSVTSK